MQFHHKSICLDTPVAERVPRRPLYWVGGFGGLRLVVRGGIWCRWLGGDRGSELLDCLGSTARTVGQWTDIGIAARSVDAGGQGCLRSALALVDL